MSVNNPGAVPEKTLKRRFILVLACVVLAILALVAARPAYHALKAWRARRLAAQSGMLLAQSNRVEAAQKALAAYLLSPGEPAAIRAVAKIQTDASQASALMFWRRLADSGQATAEDRRDYVRVAIQSGELDQARFQLRTLLLDAPNQPVNLWLLSHLCLAERDYSSAWHFAADAKHQDPTNQVYRLYASELAFDSSEPTAHSEARRTVWTLAQDQSAIGLQAMDYLGQRRDLTPDQARELIAMLGKHPKSGVPQRLLALSLGLKLEPNRRGDLLDQAMREFQAKEPEDVQRFAVWLGQQGEFDRVLSVLPLANAIKRTDFFIVHLDALASLGRWAQIDGILKRPEVPLEKVYQEGFRARCALQLTNAPLADVCWNHALQAAEGNPDALWWLAQYAEKNGSIDPARRAYRRWIGCVREPRPGYQALARLIESRGTTAELRDLLGEMAARWPGNDAYRNDHAYLNLLLGENLDDSRRTAEALVSENPGSLPHLTTLALAYYRDHDHAAALNLYRGRNYDWGLALAGNRAVFAAVLAANGATNDAQRLLRDLPPDRLRKEERELTGR